MSTPRDSERRFLQTVTSWILSLPHDLKVLFEAKDEPNLERAARETAAGALLYVLGPDTSGDEKYVGFADDAILIRAALQKVIAQGGEGAPAFQERFQEHFTDLERDLGLCQQVMGETYTWLAGKVENLHKQSYKGKKVPVYLDDDEDVELLYEDGLAFATDYPIDEDKLAMRIKRPETLLEPLRRKALEERKRLG